MSTASHRPPPATCLVCLSRGWPDRGCDWPVTDLAGALVHEVCARQAKQVLRFPHEAYLDAGAYRWHANGQVVPADVLALAIAFGVADPAYLASTDEERGAETAAFLADYRSRPHPMSEEQSAEARAAFGAGSEVVDVVGGERYRL